MLDETVIDDRQWLAVAYAEDHHQATPGSGLNAIFFFGLAIRPINHIGFHSDGKNADLSARAFHGSPAVITVGPIARHPQIQARPIHRVTLEKIIVTVFQGFQTIFHREQLFDFAVVDQKHG